MIDGMTWASKDADLPSFCAFGKIVIQILRVQVNVWSNCKHIIVEGFEACL